MHAAAPTRHPTEPKQVCTIDALSRAAWCNGQSSRDAPAGANQTDTTSERNRADAAATETSTAAATEAPATGTAAATECQSAGTTWQTTTG